jgi:cysteine desulfurase
MARTSEIAMSSGSACTSESLEPSYVLKALGAGDEQAHTSIRMGLGRFTTKEEVLAAVDIIVKQVNELREISPLWEMIEEGIDLSKIKWTQDH